MPITITRLLLAVAAAGLLIGAATVNQMYISSAVVGDAALRTGIVIVDPPLTMTRDTAGRVHIGGGTGSGTGGGGVGGGPIPATHALVDTFLLSAGVIDTGYTFTLAHTPAVGSIMLLMIRSSRIGEDHVMAVLPATNSLQPRVVTIQAPPAGHPLTGNDTMTVAYWTSEP